MVRQEEVPEGVHQVQRESRRDDPLQTSSITNLSTRLASEQYLLAGALDGGTQVISFILNFAVFGAAGNPTDFPEWWGNDLSLSTDRCLRPPVGKTRDAAE
jgi:hypothetical protein